MAKQVQLRRGTTAQHATFTGAEGEVTYDTEKKVLIAHDGQTQAGYELTRKVQSIAFAIALGS
jgi:hypothetical protein